MNDLLISVIVPVYNVSKYLHRCVNSIVEQSYSNLEIILVDDGSTDGSSMLCDQIATSDDRIIVIHKDNGGLSSARNVGIDNCSGDYIGFVDSDDWIEKNMYQCLIDANIRNSTSIACAGRFDVSETGQDKRIGLLPESDEVVSSEQALQMLLTWNTIDSSACDKLFKKDLFKSIRFPEGKLSEDVAVMYLIFDEAQRISLCSEPVYNYFHHGDTITSKKFKSGKLDSLEHSERIIRFINEKYPSIISSACFFRMKTIENILGSLVSAPQDMFNTHRILCEKMTIEYRQGIKDGVIRRKSIRFKLKDFLFSHFKLILIYRKLAIRSDK